MGITTEVKDLTDQQIWEVVADVLRDDLIPDLFERVLGVRGPEKDPVSIAAEWARWDIETNMKNWGEEGKVHKRKFVKEGNYKQPVFNLIRHHRDHYDTKEVKGLTDHQIWEAVELALRDDLIPNVFKEVLFGDDIEKDEDDNAEHDPIWEAAEWARRDFENHMKSWREVGKSNHRKLAKEGNYKQSVFNHFKHHKDPPPHVKELSDDQIWEVVEVVLRDDLIPRVYQEALFGDDEPEYGVPKEPTPELQPLIDDRKLTYFSAETDVTIALTSPPTDYNALKEHIGESRGIFSYYHAGDENFIHDQQSYESAWARCGNYMEIYEKNRMRV